MTDAACFVILMLYGITGDCLDCILWLIIGSRLRNSLLASLLTMRIGIGDLIRSDDPGTNGGKGIAGFPGQPGGGQVLKITAGQIIGVAVPQYMIHGLFLGDQPAGLADDHRQLTLVIQIFGVCRYDDLPAVGSGGFGKLAEYSRKVRFGQSADLEVTVIVRADADDFIGPWDTGRVVQGRLLDIDPAADFSDILREPLQRGLVIHQDLVDMSGHPF